jgi:WD40 repeat protein
MSPPDVYAVAWSPDRKKLVSSDARNSLTIWSETGEKIKTLERNGAGNLSWSPDSRQFVAILGHGEPEIFTVE